MKEWTEQCAFVDVPIESGHIYHYNPQNLLDEGTIGDMGIPASNHINSIIAKTNAALNFPPVPPSPSSTTEQDPEPTPSA